MSSVEIVAPGATVSDGFLELDDLIEFSHRLRLKLAARVGY
jgi:hypothetical protein